jgi:hypothetical protein
MSDRSTGHYVLTGMASTRDSPIRGRPSTAPGFKLDSCLPFAMAPPSSHPFARRRAELLAELRRVGQPLADPRLTPDRKEAVIAAYEQALRRVFALDEEAGVE